jgi:hypothetical protein
LDYGTDVFASKELIKQLQIEDNVIWLPKMSRKYLYSFIDLSTVCAGVIGRSTVTNCSIYEILYKNKAIILTRDDKDLINKGLSDLYPVLNVNDNEDVYNQLSYCIKFPDKINTYGIESRNWVVEKNKDRLTFLINELKIRNKELNYNLEFLPPKLLFVFSKIIEKIKISIIHKIKKNQ